MAAATATPALLTLDPQDVERLARARNEPDWLLSFRLASLERLTSESWPTGAEEEWRRFPLTDLPRGPLVDAAGGHPPGEYSALPVEAAHRGVIFDRWVDAVRDHPDEVRRWLGSGGGIATHGAFQALNDAAFAHGSTFLYVPQGVTVELPLHVHKRWTAGESAIVFRTVIVVEPGASVTFVEELSSEGGGNGRVAIPGVEVHLGRGAQLRYVRIQRFADDVWDLGYQRYDSGQDSALASFNVLVGSGRSKVGVLSDMSGDGAEVKLYGLVAGAGAQRIDVNSLQEVKGKGSASDLLYLSALYDSAKAVYYGVIRVAADSSGTGSYQECRNMLLSDKAGADPIPVLEILTNDVARCGHAATAGALDEADLFYVMSRGLDRAGAEQLLVRGFFQRVIDNIPEVQVRSKVIDALAPRIGRVAELEIEAAA